MGQVEVDGLTVAFERAGTGPPVVLLHGYAGDGLSLWRHQIDALSEAYTVVAWDAPGAGGSSDPPEDFGIDGYAECLAAFIRLLHLEPAHVVGGPSLQAMPPTTGDKAPAFNLSDQHGNKIRLSSFKGRKVLVYFYPKADTPGCTTQACGLRDIAGDIGDTVVLGISPDAPNKLAKFDEKYGLGFALLSDPGHTTADAYGAWGEKSMYGKKYEGIIRSAYLVDEKGRVSHAWPKISPKDTPTNLLKALAE